MKISLFVHDLSVNPIGRAYPIARALQQLGYEVEVLGFLLNRPEIYAPYRDSLPYLTIKVPYSFFHVLYQSPKLAAMATGNIIYAFKPLWTSFFPALLASKANFGNEKPLLLDIDDDELATKFDGVPRFIARHSLVGWNHPGSWKYKLLLDCIARKCTHKTLMSQKLQRRYGGQVLLHGPNEQEFDPQRPDLLREHCRQSLNLPLDVPLALFVGRPLPYKGIDKVVTALQQQPALRYHLVLVGDTDNPIYQAAKVALGDRCHLYGYMHNQQMPALLTAVDVVPIIQQFHSVTESQVPAKLLEAMAMAKPIVASWVGDLPEILGFHEDHPRGWLVSPTDTVGLANTLAFIADHPDEAQQRGNAARRYFLDHASTDALSHKLGAILHSVTQGRVS
jgi:glycosyltransferase involved in cell wall biosynthesis